MNSARSDFSPRGNWRDHHQEALVRRWQATVSDAARIGFICATALACCVIIAWFGL